MDGDTLVYTAAFAAEELEESGSTLVLEGLIKSLCATLGKHLKKELNPRAMSNSGELKVYLTSNDKSNFRFRLATRKPYKENRSKRERPKYYLAFREYLIKHYKAIVVSGYEADDALSIEMNKDPRHTILIGNDKDFRQVPGWHFWFMQGQSHPKKPYYVDHGTGFMQLERSNSGTLEVFATGEYQIAYQMLLGDTSDNIQGIKTGWGPAKCYDYLNQHEATSFSPILTAKEAYKEVHGSLLGKKYAEEAQSLVTLLVRPPKEETS